MNPKVKSMLAHLTPLGWLICLVLNNINKDHTTSFYLRQAFGIFLCFLLARIFQSYYIAIWAVIFVFWIYSFVGALKGIMTPIPFLGSYFQKWFKTIS